MRIETLDTTLRDGAQAEGVSLSVEDKLKIIRALDNLGVDYIEAGNPAANVKDERLFLFAHEKMTLKRATLAAFGMTRRAGGEAKRDERLIKLANCGARVVSIVGKADAFQAEEVLKTGRGENLIMIEDSVRFLAEAGIEVFFDAEHFFDGFRADPDYALAALNAAARGGARRLVLCDTNGGTLPEFAHRAVSAANGMFPGMTAIHAHNDADLATAVTLAGVAAGAIQVQGTINGCGERCGNANLCAVLPNLAIKLGYEVLNGSLAELSGAARFIAGVANIQMSEKSPYVGGSAFAHKAGLHIDGVIKNPRSFEHVDPELVGNRRRYLISDQAGRGALINKLSHIAPDVKKDSREADAILGMLKMLEACGYSFEDADASLELRMLGALNRRPGFFTVVDFQVHSSKPENSKNAHAYVKLRVGEAVEITADEGDGPVDALDRALKKAISRFYPSINGVRLVDFKVRVVENHGTASSVRVNIESTDGSRVWSTVGVSTNIIEASFIALTDSVEYLLMVES